MTRPRPIQCASCSRTATIPAGMPIETWANLAGWLILDKAAAEVVCRTCRPHTREDPRSA